MEDKKLTKSEELENKLFKEKEKWNNLIQSLVQQIKHVDNLADTQVLTPTWR